MFTKVSFHETVKYAASKNTQRNLLKTRTRRTIGKKYLSFLISVLEAKCQKMYMRGFLPVHGPRVDRLRQELVHAVGGLVVHRRVTLFPQPLGLLRHFILYRHTPQFTYTSPLHHKRRESHLRERGYCVTHPDIVKDR